MAATLDSVDLLGTDLEHPRLRPRFAGPAAPPPRAIERLPRSMPATIDLEAPVWPLAEAAPALVETDDVELPEAEPPPLVAAALVLAVEPPVQEPPVRVVDEPPVRAVEQPPVRVVAPTRPVVLHLEEPPVRAAPPIPRAFFEPEFDAFESQWFEEEAFLAERPAGLPWWALAIPASAALGMVSMVVTALVLLVAWT